MPNGDFCPYKQNALQSPEGSAFWEMVKLSGADIKIGGLGVVLGFDSSAILNIAKIKNQNLGVVLELLPYANMGLLDAAAKNGKKDNGD